MKLGRFIRRGPRLQERKYQLADLSRIFVRLKEARRVLYVLPTGGGKTVIAARYIAQQMLAGHRVLALVHRVHLLQQMYRQLERELGRLGVKPDCIGVIWRNDKRTNVDAPIQIASIDTLRRRKKPKADALVIDEAHRAVARKFLDVIGWYPDATVLGLT